MRLVDADDAVGASADVLIKHLLLLLVHLERRLTSRVSFSAVCTTACRITDLREFVFRVCAAAVCILLREYGLGK